MLSKKQISKMIVEKKSIDGSIFTFYKNLYEKFSDKESIVFHTMTAFIHELDNFSKEDIIKAAFKAIEEDFMSYKNFEFRGESFKWFDETHTVMD